MQHRIQTISFCLWLMMCLCICTRLCTWVVGVTVAFKLTTILKKLKMSGILLNCSWLGQKWNVWTEIFHSRFTHQTEFYSKHSDKTVHLFQRMRLGKVCCFTSFKEHQRTVSHESWNRTQKLLVVPSLWQQVPEKPAAEWMSLLPDLHRGE